MLLAALVMVLASCGGEGEGIITTGDKDTSSGQTTTISGRVALSSASSSSKPAPAMLMKADQMARKASQSLNKARHEKTARAQASYKASLPGVPQFSMEKVYERVGLAPAIIIGDVSLYDADHPEWLFPISESKFNPDGTYFLNTTSNAALNAIFANTVDYVDGQPVPAGKYTLIAKTDQTLTGELLIGVQAVVKHYVGDVTGNDLVIQDSDALPSVVSMFGHRPNLEGNFGGQDFVVPLNGAVQLTFSMAMARLTILSGGVEVDNITNTAVGAIDGTWKVSPDLLSATFYPDNDLEEGDIHRVTVRGGSLNPNVKNVYGKTMNKTITGTFIVGPEDVTAPEAIRISPPKKVKANMPITTPLRIAADEPLDLNTMEVASSPSIGVKPNVIFIGKTLEATNYPFIYEIVPSEPFDLSKNYLVTVSGAKDLALNDMIDLTFNFTTESTSAGIDPGASVVEQDAQADVKDVFGKWIRAFDDRSIPVLTSYMSGDFLWAGGGGSDDLNRDGLLSLGEFSSMLEEFFLFLEGCDSDVSGAIIGNIVVSDFDTADLAPFDRATMKFTITTTPKNTTNTQCTSEGPDKDEVLTANLELRNGSWIIVSGADAGSTPPTGTHRAISLVSPADNAVLATTDAPTMIWNGIDGVETYAVVMLSARNERAGWVALVDSDGLDTKADQYEVTYTPDIGYADGLKVNGTDIPDGIYALCNYENPELCAGRLQNYFDIDRRINVGMREGSNINWSVIGLGVLNTTDLITDGIGQRDIANDVVAAAESQFFSVAGEWKELTVTVAGKSGGIYEFSQYVNGYDVGSADSVAVIINAPAEWANGTGTLNHYGLGSSNSYPLTFDAQAQVRVDLDLYNKYNDVSIQAYKPGAETDAGRLGKYFNVLTTGGIPAGLEIDSITDFSTGAGVELDSWGRAISNTVKSVNIYGHINDPVITNLRLNLWGDAGSHEEMGTVDGSGSFVFVNVPVFEGWNSIEVYDYDWYSDTGRDYVSIEVEAPGGSVFINPIRFLGGPGLTETQSYVYRVNYDAGALSIINAGVEMDNLGSAVDPWDYAGWYESMSDPEGYNYTGTGYWGEINPDGSWLRYSPDGSLDSSGGSISSILFDLFEGRNIFSFYDEFRTYYRTMEVITTTGKIYVPPIDVSFTLTAPAGATTTSKYVSGNSSDWDTDADSISLNMVMNKLGLGTTYRGYIDHYLSTDTDWMRVGYTMINAAAAGEPLGSWQHTDPMDTWQPLPGIANQGASISDIPIDLYTGQNVFYIYDGNNGWYYLYVTTTAGKTFTPDISKVTAYEGTYTPGAAEILPQYGSSSYGDYQTDVDSVTLWVEARYDDTWPLDGSSNMINGVAFSHQAQGIWQTYYLDLNTSGNALSPTFELIAGNNWIDVCYKPVPDPYDENYIQSCAFRYTVYMSTTGGALPPQWIYVDSPAHDVDIPFNAIVDVMGHIDNSSDGFDPDYLYAYLINTTPGGGWGDSVSFYNGMSPTDPQYLSYDPVTMEFSFTGQFYADLPQMIYISTCGWNILGENKCHYAYSYVNNIYDQDFRNGKPGVSGRTSAPMIPERYYGIPR
jgi:hypothetical protein